MGLLDLFNVRERFEEAKRELKAREEVLERDGVRVVFNGTGDILDIQVEDQEVPFSKVKETLIELLNESIETAREIAEEELNKKFGGLLKGLGIVL